MSIAIVVSWYLLQYQHADNERGELMKLNEELQDHLSVSEKELLQIRSKLEEVCQSMRWIYAVFEPYPLHYISTVLILVHSFPLYTSAELTHEKRKFHEQRLHWQLEKEELLKQLDQSHR